MKPPLFRESFRLGVRFPSVRGLGRARGRGGGLRVALFGGLGPDPFSPVRWGRWSVTPQEMRSGRQIGAGFGRALRGLPFPWFCLVRFLVSDAVLLGGRSGAVGFE